MSLHSFLHHGDAPAPPARITIRRRLLGRGSRLRTVGLAAGLLSLGLASIHPAQALTKTWDGTVGDWYSDPTHWSPSGFPGAGDDAQNLFTNAAMTLGASATVNSFFSNSAFTLNGGTFSGGQVGAASTLQVNNIFTLNGGTINNFTLNAGVQQAGQPAPSVVVTNSGGNDFVNSVVNANLDLVTNNNAFLRFQGTDTVNGTISLGTTSNGLNIYTSGDNLIIGGSGKLIGFGNIFETGGGSILTNNGTVNANVSAKALTQTNTNFINSGTAEATAGGTLALNNTLTNSGKLIADGAGSTLTLSGTLASNAGNTISATNGGQIQVNGVALSGTLNGVGATSLIFNNSGNNGFNGTTANINLDLVTNNNAFLRFQGTDTVNGTISLGTTSNGLNIYTLNDNLILSSTGKLIGFGNIFETGGGSILTNNGLINATGGALTQTNTNFVNSGTAEATAGGTLALNNTLTNSGKLIADGAGSTLTLSGTLASNAGNTISATNGGQIQVNGVALSGTLNGVGATSLIFNNSGNNGFNNTTANINLDLATNANAFLRFQGTDTVNGTISLGTTSNGLDIYTLNDNLILSSTASLVGFGNVYEQGGGSILTNNGTINANVNGKALTQTNTNFVNNSLAEATNGATLALNNTITNNGALAATGGGILTLAGTLASNAGNTINGVGGTVDINGVALSGTINGVGATSLIFNNSGNNGFNGTTANINLDLVTNNNAFLRFQGTDTVNGAISLGTTSNGLDIYTSGDKLVLNGSLTGFGNVYEQGGGSILTNNGTINANVNGKALTQTNTNFVNNSLAEATNGATLALNNTIGNSAGATIAAVGAGSLVTLANGTFTGTGTTNLLTASGGGQIQVNGVALRGVINTDAATSLILNNSGNNGLLNTTVNGNLSLTNDSFLLSQGTDTVNGAISLSTTSNGLDIYTSGDNLILNGSLVGFGTVYEQGGGSILTNNGTINANVSGKTLAQTNTNFVNNSLAEATNGATLALNNTIGNSAGATIAAVGAGSLVTLANGTFTGTGTTNLLTASGGGQIQVNGVALRGVINTDAATSLILNNSGNNNLTGTTVNGNLSLTNDSFLRFQGTDTVNGTISLSTTSNGLNIYTSGDNLILGSTGKLVGYGTTSEAGAGSTLTNQGLVSANVAGQTLNIQNTNFSNTGTAQATNGATLNVTSPNATNSGTVFADLGATATFTQGLTQTAGLTQVFGTLNASEAVNGGVLGGTGQIFGSVTNTGGTVKSVNYVTPTKTFSLAINGDFTQSGTGALDVFFGNNFHNLLTVTGQTTLGGTLGVFDLDSTPFTGTGSIGSKFTFLDYSNTLNATGSAGGFTQYFSNEIPDSNNSGLITGQNGFVYELLNDTANKQLDLQVVTAGSPVPEASTTVSFGLLLLLGLGGAVVAARRRKA